LWRKKKGRGKPQEKLSERGLSDEKKIKIHETCDRRKAVAARRQAFSPTRQRCPRIVQILQPQPPSLLSCLATRVAARRSEDRGRDATPRRPPPRLQAGACRRPAGRVGGCGVAVQAVQAKTSSPIAGICMSRHSIQLTPHRMKSYVLWLRF
jgi:hypothetical protein